MRVYGVTKVYYIFRTEGSHVMGKFPSYTAFFLERGNGAGG